MNLTEEQDRIENPWKYFKHPHVHFLKQKNFDSKKISATDGFIDKSTIEQQSGYEIYSEMNSNYLYEKISSSEIPSILGSGLVGKVYPVLFTERVPEGEVVALKLYSPKIPQVIQRNILGLSYEKRPISLDRVLRAEAIHSKSGMLGLIMPLRTTFLSDYLKSNDPIITNRVSVYNYAPIFDNLADQYEFAMGAGMKNKVEGRISICLDIALKTLEILSELKQLGLMTLDLKSNNLSFGKQLKSGAINFNNLNSDLELADYGGVLKLNTPIPEEYFNYGHFMTFSRDIILGKRNQLNEEDILWAFGNFFWSLTTGHKHILSYAEPILEKECALKNLTPKEIGLNIRKCDDSGVENVIFDLISAVPNNSFKEILFYTLLPNRYRMSIENIAKKPENQDKNLDILKKINLERLKHKLILAKNDNYDEINKKNKIQSSSK